MEATRSSIFQARVPRHRRSERGPTKKILRMTVTQALLDRASGRPYHWPMPFTEEIRAKLQAGQAATATTLRPSRIRSRPCRWATRPRSWTGSRLTSSACGARRSGFSRRSRSSLERSGVTARVYVRHREFDPARNGCVEIVHPQASVRLARALSGGERPRLEGMRWQRVNGTHEGVAGSFSAWSSSWAPSGS